jgi:CO/xanthine dehydrogenase Mo-binding subunit
LDRGFDPGTRDVEPHKAIGIGDAIPRFDARSKVTGGEKYAADYYGDRFLWCGVKRAGIPHARILRIHVETALDIPGVIAVLTHRDVKGSNRQGVIRKDQPVLADGKVRHCGDPLALVVAEDRETMSQAIGEILVDLEPMPGVFDPEEALRPGSPLVHEESPSGNILLTGEIKTGHTERGFAECLAIVEGRFRLPRQEHAYLETEAGWAVFRKESGLEIVASTQSPFRDRAEVAEALGLESDRVRIIAPYCGGAFGGKDGLTVQSLLGLAALRCPGRPVKMWWNREESFLAGVKRHPAHLYYRLGAEGDGTFKALEARIYYDTGPYDHLGGAVMTLGLEHAAGPYRIPNVRIKAWVVYTNNPVGGAFRGFGVPQVTGAMEQMVDRMAERLGFDPIGLRLKNAVREGTGSTAMVECLEGLKAHPLWKDRENWKAACGPFKSRGVGIASVMHGIGYGPVVPDEANAKIELTSEGRFRVFSGVVDMGQGNASTYLQIAGHILKQGLGQMELVLPDTLKALPSGSASASRTTYTFGNALIGACSVLRDRVLEQGGQILRASKAEEVELIPGQVRNVATSHVVPLSRIAASLDEAQRTVTHHYRAPVSRERPGEDDLLMLHGLPHRTFSFGAHLACVEVDQLTGEVGVKRYLAVSDCGRIMNPQIFEQQIQGGIAQGIGYALYEDFAVQGGSIKSLDLSTYIIPSAMDLPDMDSCPVEKPEETGPFGLKGAGEIGTDGPLPAIANALADACGIRLEQFPMTLERVLNAMRSEERGALG